MAEQGPRILLLCSLFPSSAQPLAGLFIRERLRQVMPPVEAVVVSPRPWFPMQSLVRLLRPGYRLLGPVYESQSGFDVFYPRFFALPGVGRRFDGFFMALGARRLVRRLASDRGIELIDAHFAYPDGYAGSLLSRWLDLPLLITLRGTEARACGQPPLKKRLLAAIARASHVVAVANSLKAVVVAAGADGGKITRIGNGVDTRKFHPLPREAARQELGVAADAPVLVSVGGLVPRKGFHRVIEVLPALRMRWPDLQYLVVGGPGPEGDFSNALREQVRRLNLDACVRFLGALPPDQLRVPLSAADVFVLATENEGWANVFLEAMACGLPVVTTDVGGNPEVVENETLGRLVPLGDAEVLSGAINDLLEQPLDRERIRAHAQANDWTTRKAQLLQVYRNILRAGA